MLRSGELTPTLQAFQHAPVRLNMTADVSKHAVNSKLGTIPPGLLVRQHDTRRIDWVRGACLFLKRWVAYLKRWCIGHCPYLLSRSKSKKLLFFVFIPPRQVVGGYLSKRNRARGMR